MKVILIKGAKNWQARDIDLCAGQCCNLIGCSVLWRQKTDHSTMEKNLASADQRGSQSTVVAEPKWTPATELKH